MFPPSLTVTAPLIESDVLKYVIDDWYCKDEVTIAAPGSGNADISYELGTVLGKVTATGKYVQINFGASDGSQHAAAVLLRKTNAAAGGADVKALALLRGGIVLGVPNGAGAVGGLVWPAGATDNQKAGAITELAALNPPILANDS